MYVHVHVPVHVNLICNVQCVVPQDNGCAWSAVSVPTVAVRRAEVTPPSGNRRSVPSAPSSSITFSTCIHDDCSYVQISGSVACVETDLAHYQLE